MLAGLPGAERYCALRDRDQQPDGWAGWNLGRAQARDELRQLEDSLVVQAQGAAAC